MIFSSSDDFPVLAPAKHGLMDAVPLTRRVSSWRTATARALRASPFSNRQVCDRALDIVTIIEPHRHRFAQQVKRVHVAGTLGGDNVLP